MLHHPDYAVSLYQALKDDPFYRALENSVHPAEGAADAMLAYYDLSMQDAARWGRLTLSREDAHGAAVWSVPLSPDDAAARRVARAQALADALGEQGARKYDKMAHAIAQRETDMALDDHWYLSILGVAPACQGRGLGAKLLHPVLDEIDRAGTKSYITTFSPGNIRFYEALGYAVAATFPDVETGSHFSVLIR